MTVAVVRFGTYTLYLAYIAFLSIVGKSNGSSLLVDTPSCRIPKINPFDRNAMKLLSEYNEIGCSAYSNLVQLVRIEPRGEYVLQVNENLAKNIPKCCMKVAKLIEDYEIVQSPCFYFARKLIIPRSAEYISVECMENTEDNPKQLYRNVFFLVQEKVAVRKRFARFKSVTESPRAPSVLILGVDSLGRINLQRSMPKVFKFLKDNHFYDMKGFNKIGLNTFPNLMASLAGIDIEIVSCMDINDRGDNCSLIWKDFKRHGYATAYSEDYTTAGTFHYGGMKGFQRKPVDHYGRTGFLLTEKWLMGSAKDIWSSCRGMRYLAEYILTHALDFAKFYKGQPYFGLFWTNTLSHNEANQLKTLEPILINTLKQIKGSGVLQDSIVILMGDHGFRFHDGNRDAFYNSRLPPLFISLPQWYKDKFQGDGLGLKINQRRLITHYDLHLTLEDILKRSGRAREEISGHTSCRNCQSLFRPVLTNRTCSDVGIPLQFCACQTDNLSNFKFDSIRAARWLVGYINEWIKRRFIKLKRDPSICEVLHLKEIKRVRKIKENSAMVNFITSPGNQSFEAVVKIVGPKITLDGQIERISLYGGSGDCVQDVKLKNYCECIKTNK